MDTLTDKENPAPRDSRIEHSLWSRRNSPSLRRSAAYNEAGSSPLASGCLNARARIASPLTKASKEIELALAYAHLHYRRVRQRENELHNLPGTRSFLFH